MNRQEDDTHAEELNERMDAGGCTDTWETLAELRDGDDVGRRRVLEGVAGLSIAVLGSGTVAAAAAPDDAETKEDVYSELGDGEAKRILASLANESSFNRLEKLVKERGERLHRAEATVARVDGETEFVIVDVPVADTDAEEGHLVVGRDEETGAVTVATLEYVEETVDGIPTEITTHEATADAASIEKTTHTVDPDVARQLAEGSTSAIGTQSIDITCDGCIAAVGLVCQIGCHAGTAFICGVLTGAGLIAGGACFTFVGIVCGLISIYGCGGQLDYEAICSDPDLGLC